MRDRAKRRPSRREVDPAALRLLERHGAQILTTARRYSATPEDAEDAYQRAVEILLTKAPTTDESELVPWLKTVVKHEAFAIRRQRERSSPTTDDGEPSEPPDTEAATHDRAERWERLRLGAEALKRLKPHEVRCLLLKAEGYSYREICEITGWTYTKVNRCLTEGRKAFLERVAGIEAGSECERLAPLLSALVDGEASADDLQTLRPHLKTCLTCRARLKEFRAAPPRVAALVPPGLVATGSAGDGSGALRGLLESVIGATQDKAAAFGERAHAAAELATGQKVAAVAASAALAGGGATGVSRLAGDESAGAPGPAAEVKPVKQELPGSAPVGAVSDPQPASAPVPAPPPPPQPQPPPPDPANEFAPGPAATSAPGSSTPAPPSGDFAPAGGPPGGGGGEFGP